MTDTTIPAAAPPSAVPAHSFDIKIGKEVMTVFMSFSLLNRICYIMGDGTQIPLILQDAELREAVLKECLAVRSSLGKIQKVRELDELEFTHDDALDLLEWVTEHVTNFTVAAVGRAHKVMVRNQTKMDAVKSSSSTSTPTGSETSPSKSPAA